MMTNQSNSPPDVVHNSLETDLANANRDLKQLSFSVSHDLRAPLRAIEGYASILLEDYCGQLDADGQQMLEAIADNTRKLSDQIAAILEYSRAGRLESQPVTIDMTGLFQEVWDEMAPPDREIHFECVDLPPARGDRAAVRTLIIKLLDNAVKFTGGRDATMIQITSEECPPNQCYTVSDNGAGFDMAYADKLFGLFQRLHTVDEFPGLGTGLAIARLLLERQDGWIRGEGQPGVGARFTFALPNNE